MIARLRGTVVECTGNQIILDVQGVGYLLTCTSNLIGSLSSNEEVDVTVHTEVREDSIQLFGFSDLLEKRIFTLLTTVKGVGSKSGCEIVSRIDVRDLLRAIAGGDVGALQRIKGIGKKTAERIVVELKDKVAEFTQQSSLFAAQADGRQIEVQIIPPVGEAVEALCALGFPRSEADALVAKVDQSVISAANASEIVREALRFV
jgi:Holliday junction DNA helicase RuvA